ncbi:2-oxo acid dehydrogenase subunit E2, partial [Arthrobacter sp. H5]|uniref:2-oxo acid dehydrogenase subunit E2 n=1 Tax=Arthrobacter sp. H5 TaxID=1267973 RepID=UPI00056AD2D5
MPEQSNHRLPEEFGGNEWLVDELYGQFQKDRNSVDKKWWTLFESFETDNAGSENGRHAATPSESTSPGDDPHPVTRELPVVNTEKDAPKASGESPASTQESGKPPVPKETRSKDPRKDAGKTADTPAPRQPAKKDDAKASATAPIPAQLPKSDRNTDMDEDTVNILRGPAKAIATNMDASLTVPTATSVRSVPAKLLIDNRVVINNHLERARGGKVSFTHLIGYAIIRALAQFPSQNVYYDVVDGKPAAIQPAHVNFGLAIDMPRPDGSRLLVVPNIKKAEDMNFSDFWHAYEELVKKARAGKLGADDYAGTTVSLTNPGGIGTVHSVPRLSKGQACIIGAGALEYPAAFQGASEKTLAQHAISKTITLTSTYDHRVIQGAGSGEFLRIVHQLLLGEQNFYDEIFEALRIPYEPVRWSADIQVDPMDEINKVARIQQLIHAYRVRGHLMADTNPLEYVQRKHADLDVRTHGLTLWDLDREWPTGG